MFNQKNIVFFLILILVFLYFGYFLKTYPVSVFTQPEQADMSLFWEAWEIVQNKFINQEKIDNDVLIQGAISGMLKSLEDDYSVFLNPEETEIFLEDTEGFFQGIGAEIGLKEGQLQIIAPLPETPAQKAGLMSGDKILKIDEKSTQDMKIDEAVRLIRGPEGSEVVLSIIRDNWDEPRDFSIKRAIIKIPSLEWKIINNNIAYIKIYHFNKLILNDFSQAVNEFLKKDIRGIVLDLRNNPGGYLDVSVEISKWFLAKDNIILIEERKIDKEIIYKNDKNGKLLDYPLVVLINQGSASGAEIVAGALKDNQRAKIVGEPSFGKGSVQSLEILKNFSSIKITIAKWYTPNKEPINNIGIKPDYIIEMTEKDYLEEKDPQLEKALELILKIN